MVDCHDVNCRGGAAFEQDEIFVRDLFDQITSPQDERGSLAWGLYVQAARHGSAIMLLF